MVSGACLHVQALPRRKAQHWGARHGRGPERVGGQGILAQSRGPELDLRLGADLFFAQLIAKSSHTSVHAETMIITTAIASSALCITLPRAFP